MNIDPQQRVERLRRAHPRRAPDADPEGRRTPFQPPVLICVAIYAKALHRPYPEHAVRAFHKAKFQT